MQIINLRQIIIIGVYVPIHCRYTSLSKYFELYLYMINSD